MGGRQGKEISKGVFMINKELFKKIVLFFCSVVFVVILLLPAIDNFKTKEQYEQDKKHNNEIMYNKYFNKGVNNE